MPCDVRLPAVALHRRQDKLEHGDGFIRLGGVYCRFMAGCILLTLHDAGFESNIPLYDAGL